MGSNGNSGLGKAWDCSRMHGIAQGSKGECTGALKLQNAGLYECMPWWKEAVVDGFCSMAAKEKEGRHGRRGTEAVVRGCESRFYVGKARGVSGEGPVSNYGPTKSSLAGS